MSEQVNAMKVAVKIASLIERAPAGGIFHDATIGEIAISRGHVGMNSTTDFRIDLNDGPGFVVRVEPLV